MKIKKRIAIVADILVDEDFDTNYLCIAEMVDIGSNNTDEFLGQSDNFEVLDYISQDAVELEGTDDDVDDLHSEVFSKPCIDCENNSSEKCNHCFDEGESDENS